MNMKTKYMQLCVIFSLLLLFQGCSTKEQTRDTRPSNQASTDSSTPAAIRSEQAKIPKIITDQDKLLLIEHLPLNVNYPQAKKLFPYLSHTTAEGNSTYLESKGLTEAFLDMKVFSHKARIELNFKDDRLYSYYYSINLLNKKTASELYEKIWCFYTERHGKPNWETKNSESNYISHSSFWNSENYAVVLTNNIFPAKCILSWGFQRR